MTKTNAHLANCNIGRLIEADAMAIGMDRFFKDHVISWHDPKNFEDPRAFAKRATHDLPDYCSFNAFYAKFEDRFIAWFETGDIDGIAEE